MTPVQTYVRYWGWATGKVRSKASEHWPIFVSLLLFPLASGSLLYLVERDSGGPINSYGNAVYTTWIIMTTVGYGDMIPRTTFGRVMVSFDALVGLLLIGLVVWLITSSLKGSPNSTGRDAGGRGRLDE